MTFSSIDGFIIAAFLILSTAAGLAARKYVANIDDFLVAGRGMNTYLGIAALSASELGLVTVMYHAELGFVGGFSASLGIIAFIVMTAVGITGFVIQKLRSLRIMTVPEFYEKRYSRNVRRLGGVIMAVGGILNMGIFIRLAADFINAVLGLSDIYLSTTCIILTALILLYTVLGGMVSVLITNYLQYVVAIIGFLVATIFIVNKIGYVHIVEGVRLHLGEPGINPFHSASSYGMTFIVYQFFLWTACVTTWQTIASRAYAAKDEKTGRRIFFWTGLTFLGRATVPMFWGMAALAYYGSEANSMTAMPRMLAELLPTGVFGVVVAAMLATYMSCTSSYLLGWSSVVAQDIIAPLFKRELSSRARILITRLTIVAIALFLLVWGLWYSIPDTAWNYLAVTGTIYMAGSLSCVAAGCYWKKATAAGAYTAILLGTVTPFGFVILTQVKDALPAWILWITDANLSTLLSYLLSAAGMFAVSLLTYKQPAPEKIG